MSGARKDKKDHSAKTPQGPTADSNMRYGITRLVLGCQQFIEIDQERFEKTVSAKKFLFEVLCMEEEMDLVLENYFEYEVDLLASTERNLLFPYQDYGWFHKDRVLFCRRLANLLTACRLYLDHTSHHLSCIYGNDSPVVRNVKSAKAAEYKSHIEYRIMEAIRNYAQHRGFPIHGCSYNSHRVVETENETAQFVYTLIPHLNIEELRQDENFKSTVLQEMESMGPFIDVKPIVRTYITCIGRIHERMRDLLRKDVERWEAALEEVMDRFKREFGTDASLAGLAVVRQDTDRAYNENAQVFRDFIEYRRHLESKNTSVGSLETRYVSGQVVRRK